jgi:hypothetical protein
MSIKNKSLTKNSISVSVKALAISALAELGFYLKHIEKFDSVFASDAELLDFVKNLTENVTVGEDAAIAFTMGTLVESVGVADTFAKIVAYNRSFTDGIALDDIATIPNGIFSKNNVAFASDELGVDLTKPSIADSVTASEIIGLFYNKQLADAIALDDAVVLPNSVLTKGNVATMSDVMSLSHHFGRFFNDSVALDDTIVLPAGLLTKGNVVAMTDLLSISYGHGRVFSDTIVLSDVENNPVGTNVLNTSMLNPGNSQFLLTKGNDAVDNFGVTDVASVGPGKNLADSFTFGTDTNYYGVGKGVPETINLTEELYFSLKTPVDTINLAEAAVNNFSKSLNESADIMNISDTINLVRVTGGVMNMIPLNRVQLN